MEPPDPRQNSKEPRTVPLTMVPPSVWEGTPRAPLTGLEADSPKKSLLRRGLSLLFLLALIHLVCSVSTMAAWLVHAGMPVTGLVSEPLAIMLLEAGVRTRVAYWLLFSKAKDALGPQHQDIDGSIVLWLAYLLPMAFIIAWRLGWMRRIARRPVAAGCCKKCGYDLRATPNRCPECGTIHRILIY